MQDKIIKLTQELEKSKEKNIKLQNDLVNAHKTTVQSAQNNNSEQMETLKEELKGAEVYFLIPFMLIIRVKLLNLRMRETLKYPSQTKFRI